MSSFSDRILRWYQQHARALPWRGHSDSYAVWVSEIMLQQTRVETVVPYFESWMIQFPSIEALANTSEQMVLSAWEGLGYYSRARNLHKAARMVVLEFDGRLPQEIPQLRKLPGIGRYTAAAIASIAFHQDVATLDGNLRRIFARVFDISTPADSPPGEEILWGLAQENLPVGRAGDYNQALMDLGSSICVPKKPLCSYCPLNDLCLARSFPENRPVLKPKKPVPHKLKMAAVIIKNEMVLLAIHPSRGLLGGLWEFPSVAVEISTPRAMIDGIENEYQLKVQPVSYLEEIHHAYTHFTLAEIAWRCDLVENPMDERLKWVPLSELEQFPMGKVDRTIAERIQ